MTTKDEIQYYPLRYLNKLFSGWESGSWPSVLAEWDRCDAHLRRELLLITSWLFPERFSDLQTHMTGSMGFTIAHIRDLKTKMDEFFSEHDDGATIYRALMNAYLVPRDERISTIVYRLLLADADWELAAEFLSIFLTKDEAIAVHDHGMDLMTNRPDKYQHQHEWSRAWATHN